MWVTEGRASGWETRWEVFSVAQVIEDSNLIKVVVGSGQSGEDVTSGIEGKGEA